MAGIEDLIEIFRGENVRLNPFRERSSSSRNYKDLWKAGKFITDRAWEAGSYARKFPAIIKSAKIPKSTWTAAKNLFDRTHFVQPTDISRTYGLLNHADKNKLKVNILKTIGVNLKNLSPLAVQGLNVLTSLPVATIAMVLKSTPANADEATMKLEDFAKLAEEAQPKEKEKMAAGGKAYSTDIKDYYRRSWGIGDRKRVGFEEGLLVSDLTSQELVNAQSAARKKGITGKKGSEEFAKFVGNGYIRQKTKTAQFKAKKVLEAADIAKSLELSEIAKLPADAKLTYNQRTQLLDSYHTLFEEAYHKGS